MSAPFGYMNSPIPGPILHKCIVLLAVDQFYKALTEVMSNPTPEVMGKWLSHPNIGPVVADLWKTMMDKGMSTS